MRTSPGFWRTWWDLLGLLNEADNLAAGFPLSVLIEHALRWPSREYRDLVHGALYL